MSLAGDCRLACSMVKHMEWSQKVILVRFHLVFFYLMHIFQSLKKSFWLVNSIIYNNINNIETAILVWVLIILSGDVEMNPGPIVYANIV